MSDSPDRSPGPADAKRPVARFLKLTLIALCTVLALMDLIMMLLGWRLDRHVELLIVAAFLVAVIAVLYLDDRNATNG